MRKFLLKVSIFAAYVILVSTIIPMWIDPFNVFHWDNIRINGVEPNKNYIKMKHILANPEKFDSFLFGSSRVGAIHPEKIIGERCYNMTNAAALPGWHLMNIKTMCENGINPKKIYVGLDSISYTGDYKGQYNDPGRCPYEHLRDDAAHFVKLYFNVSSSVRSLANLLKTVLIEMKVINPMILMDPEIFYEYGISGYGQIRIFDWNDKSKIIPNYGGSPNPDIEATLKIIRETSEICRENNIELILFTNPMHCITYLDSVRYKDYFKFLEGLAEISDFWNFSSLNDITIDTANYGDPSHYRANVGDMIINVICNGKSYPELNAQGFGVKVTRENAKDFISMLRRQIEDYEKSQQ